VEAAHHGAFGNLEYVADLLVGEAFDFAEEYDGPMFWGQTTNGFVEATPELGVTCALEGIVTWRLPLGEGQRGAATFIDLQRYYTLSGVTPLVVDTEVERDAIQPRVEGGVALETVEVRVGLCEGLLDHIRGVFSVAQHAEGQGGDLALVPLDQLPKGFVVTSLGPLHEFPVASRHARLPRKTPLGPTYSTSGHRPALPT
jgi:hypothetical protein